MATSSKDVENGKIVALLCYLIPIVGIIWYFADEKMKNNNFAKFHLKQALVLIIVMFIWSFLSAIPFLGWFVILPLGGIFILIWVIIGIVNSLGGKEKELFLIGKLAKHFTF